MCVLVETKPETNEKKWLSWGNNSDMPKKKLEETRGKGLGD